MSKWLEMDSKFIDGLAWHVVRSLFASEEVAELMFATVADAIHSFRDEEELAEDGDRMDGTEAIASMLREILDELRSSRLTRNIR